MQEQKAKYFSVGIIAIAFVLFVYVTIQAVAIVQKRQISTDDGIYNNRVTQNQAIQQQANQLVAGCQTDLCKAQKVLSYVTAIPYQINHFKAHSPQQTIRLNRGDCDDKSNLLISLLHALNIESYFVLVPKHIFVVVALHHKPNTKALWINKTPYYILESTAKNSQVGYPLRYKLNQINMILDPFENREIVVKSLEYG